MALAAKQAAEAAKAAAMKKTTITCIKGKLTKTVLRLNRYVLWAIRGSSPLFYAHWVNPQGF
jgi:hypothetical protein